MDNTMSLRSRVIALGVGESVTISVLDYSITTIRSYASELGLQLGRTFSTRCDRTNKAYSIIRTA